MSHKINKKTTLKKSKMSFASTVMRPLVIVIMVGISDVKKHYDQ